MSYLGVLPYEGNEEEIWRYTEYVGYMVSNKGNVKSLSRTILKAYTDGRIQNVKMRGRILKTYLAAGGYEGVDISINNQGRHKKVKTKVHRLVARAFLDNPENKPAVNHLNRERADNRVENLEWATNSENSKYTFTSRDKLCFYCETGTEKEYSSDVNLENMEEWRLTRYKNYMVSNLGQIKSLDHFRPHFGKNSIPTEAFVKGKILTVRKNIYGYPTVMLSVLGLTKRNRGKILVHRLVAEAFLENPEGKKEVNHINGQRHDNRVENLEWHTSKENKNHRFECREKFCSGCGGIL